MEQWELWGWMANGVIHVTSGSRGYRPDSWIKHNCRTGRTVGSVRGSNFEHLLDWANTLYQWLVQDPEIARALGI